MNYLKLLKESFIEALPLGTTLVMLYLLVMAYFNDWIITLNFNKYGEGFLELSLMILWVVLYSHSLLDKLEVKKITDNKYGNKNKFSRCD